MQFNLNDSITRKKTINKYIFWDIDGTLAPYRFNGHVGDPNGTNNGQAIIEVENGIFFKRKPSIHMQKVVNTCQAKQHIIMGHSILQKEISDKYLWVEKHYPLIKEILLTGTDVSKADTIINWCKTHQVDLSEVLFVDDVIPFLRAAEKQGIAAYHISSFLDWEYQDFD